LEAFEALLVFWDRPERLAQEIRTRFELHPAEKGIGEKNALFTGYYQPVLEGSLSKSGEYRFPVYGRPKDLIVGEMVTLRPESSVEMFVGRLDGERLVPYYSRDEIDRLGSLEGKGYEIAWVKDPVDLFFLHIQGSGILSLPDGTLRQVSYAASNGRRYTSIGRVLIDRGKISEEEISMQSLRRYLAEHPDEREAILAMNESYIFFRFVEQGPVGSLGLPLTGGRSVATDARLYPKGALAWITTSMPLVDSTG
ncbi:MAG: transglycosylase, partial [Candidatus Latescibacteria bacterium]|nr:transglycosylase [Candidatus Latescibacterota bacterium]